MIKPWLRFFRVVNLPTVPGDVLVGAAAVITALEGRSVGLWEPAMASLASVFLYLFGLADNDIVGAKTDCDRPVATGEISLTAARAARALCVFAAIAVGVAAHLLVYWWVVAFVLLVAMVAYNRTKGSLLMGLCRGLNVICGGVLWCASSPWLFVCAGLWTVYIAAVTEYSTGEETDSTKKRRVGLLIGGIVYLQLVALLTAYLILPCTPTRHLVLAGAGLLIVLRLMKRFLPEVSAS